MSTSPLVLLESPFAPSASHTTEEHLVYARECMAHSFGQGEYPFASHLLYTQSGILDDTKPDERKLGIAAGLAWGRSAKYTVMYVDMGISRGMVLGLRAALLDDRAVKFRTIRFNLIKKVEGATEVTGNLDLVRQVYVKFQIQRRFQQSIRECELETAWLDKFESEFLRATEHYYDSLLADQPFIPAPTSGAV
jgi:hypothetical protein